MRIGAFPEPAPCLSRILTASDVVCWRQRIGQASELLAVVFIDPIFDLGGDQALVTWAIRTMSIHHVTSRYSALQDAVQIRSILIQAPFRPSND